MSWYFPSNLNDWRRRQVSPRSVVLLLSVAALIATEMRFDWAEHVLGNFLVTTNAARPQSGTVWEQGREADIARRALAQYSSERRNFQLETRRAESFSQVVSTVTPEKGAMLSVEHFVELYKKLPPAISHEIMSPYAMLAKLSEGKWHRAFFERREGQLLIYILDKQNQVVHRINVGRELLEHIERGEVAVSTSLDRMSDLATNIYPAEQFFRTLNTLDAAAQRRIIAHPEELLRVSDRIRRVGISNTHHSGMVDLGFEVEDAEGAKVILLQGRYEDVRRLKNAMEGRPALEWPFGLNEVNP